MNFCLILCASFGLVLTHPVNFTSPRIIGGSSASLGQFPYQVGIFHDVDGNHQVCGGSLLNHRWVITAGHCVFRANNFEIILGATELYKSQPTKQIFGVIEAHVHPEYNQPAKLNNDVALLKLDRDVIYNDYIQPIRISGSEDYLDPDVPLIMSGWGKIADSEQFVNSYLKSAPMTSISNEQCKEYFLAELVPDYVVCVLGNGTESPCNGDSGGALVKIDQDGEPTQVAVFSFISLNGCEKKYPSGYSRITDFLPFIQQYVDVSTN